MFKLAFPYVELWKKIEAPSGKVWRIMTDTYTWPRWGPSIRNVKCEDRSIKAGSTGRVQLPFGLWINFVVTDLEEGSYWSWHVFGIRATGHRIVPVSKNCCWVIFETPLYAAPYTVVCKIAIERIRVLAMTASSTRVPPNDSRGRTP